MTNNDIEEKFKGKKCLEDVLDFVLDDFTFPSEGLKVSTKSEVEADKLREEGNVYFRKKDHEKALELYNLSIMAAPHPVLNKEDTSFLSETTKEDGRFAYPIIDPARYGGTTNEENKALGKGFANRSAVMFELSLYEKCLQDINLAIEYGYPEEHHAKLEGRKQRCIAAQQAKASREKGKEAVKKSSRQGESSVDDETFNKNFDAAFHPQLSLEERVSTKTKEPPVLAEPNPNMPSLSSAVEVCYKPLQGRGLVATRDIQPGEVLGVERAFAVGVDKEKLTTHCSTCTCLCLTPLPCPGCSQVIFCSKSCRTRGLAEDHWLECRILPMLLSEMESMVCSFKLLKTFSCQELTAMLKELQREKPDRPEHLGFGSNGIYSSTSYQTVYHLCQDVEAYSLGDLIGRCTASVRITKFLELSGRYFINEVGEPVTPTREDFLKTCKILVSNFARGSLNSYAVSEDEKATNFVLLPTLSLINHSCSPSALLCHYGRQAVVAARRPIKAGEELKITYVKLFYKQEKLARMQTLEKYRFTCSCEACEGNWPTLSQLPHTRFLCLKCLVPQSDKIIICSKCERLVERESNASEKIRMDHLKQKIFWVLEEYDRIYQKVRLCERFSKEEFQSLCKATEVMYKHSSMPCLTLIKLMKAICLYFEPSFVWTP